MWKISQAHSGPKIASDGSNNKLSRFQSKTITVESQGYFIMLEESIQEVIIILNVYVHNQKASKCVKKKTSQNGKENEIFCNYMGNVKVLYW